VPQAANLKVAEQCVNAFAYLAAFASEKLCCSTVIAGFYRSERPKYIHNIR
jgi:hypothetical protein